MSAEFYTVPNGMKAIITLGGDHAVKKISGGIMTKKKAVKKSSKKIIKTKVDEIVELVQAPKMIRVKAVVAGNSIAVGQFVPGTEIEISEHQLKEVESSMVAFKTALDFVQQKIKEAQLAN